MIKILERKPKKFLLREAFFSAFTLIEMKDSKYLVTCKLPEYV